MDCNCMCHSSTNPFDKIRTVIIEDYRVTYAQESDSTRNLREFLVPDRAVFCFMQVSGTRKRLVQESMTNAEENCVSFWYEILVPDS